MATPVDFSNIVLDDCLQIGSGKFGTVYKYNDTVAIKHITCLCLDKSDESSRKLADSKMEILVLSSLSEHINIVKLLDSGVVQHSVESAVVFIAMELLHGHTLYESFVSNDVTNWTGFRRVKILLDIHSALVHVHAHGFVHLDICPNNVMILNDNRVVVVDFGFSKYKNVSQRQPELTTKHESSKRGGLGTLGYVAPENGNNPLW